MDGFEKYLSRIKSAGLVIVCVSQREKGTAISSLGHSKSEQKHHLSFS